MKCKKYLPPCIFLAVCFVSTGCVRNIAGTYRHRVCDVGPSCFNLVLLKDSSFQYRYAHDAMGSGIVPGTYRVKEDTLILTTETDKVSPIVKTFSTKSDSMHFTVKEILPNKETSQFYGQIFVNDSLMLPLNDSGRWQCARFFLKSVRLRGITVLGLRDTAFILNTADNNIELSAVMSARFDTWVSRKYLIKHRKLYPVSYEPEMVLFGDETYYKKLKQGGK